MGVLDLPPGTGGGGGTGGLTQGQVDARIGALTGIGGATYVSDLNAAPDGFAVGANNTANKPVERSLMVETISGTYDLSPWKIQTAFAESEISIWVRTQWQGAWGVWRQVGGVADPYNKVNLGYSTTALWTYTAGVFPVASTAPGMPVAENGELERWVEDGGQRSRLTTDSGRVFFGWLPSGGSVIWKEVGGAPLKVQQTDPGLTTPGMWVQTYPNGDISLWIEDGT